MNKIAEPILMQNQAASFNEDTHIQDEFISLREKFGLKNCVETGTCLGYTTAWLADQYEHVRTVEVNAEWLNMAKINRLNSKANIICYNGNSEERLAEMLEGFGDDTMIFLDAHWYENCSLHEELSIIASKGIKPVIAIHDFQVPDHPELGYDFFGEQPFTFEWLKPHFDAIYGEDGYEHYYNSEAEGAMRGIIYVTPKN